MKQCLECTKPVRSKNLCTTHYGRLWRHGSTSNIQGQRPTIDPVWRFLSKIEKQENGCWYWTSTLSKYGYGKFKVHGKTLGSHRFMWFLMKGSLPTNVQIDHLCHTNDPDCKAGVTCVHRKCVNPDHLDSCSLQENIRRRETRKK